MNPVFLFLIFSLLGTNYGFHDYHVSRTEIHYNTESRTFQIGMHLFADDVEKALELINGTAVRLDLENLGSEEQALLMDFLVERFKIYLDDRESPMNYIGMESSEDDFQGFWIYLESTQTEEGDIQVRIENVCLTDVFPDQNNIITLRVGDNKKTYHILNRNKKEFSFPLETM